MRLAILMSHASRNMDGAARELILAGALRALGVDARVWRMHPGPEIESEELRGVPVTFCPADDSAAHVHRQVSAALRAGIAAFAPDVVLYKGLGYRVNADVQAVRPEGARWGLIVGGGVTDPLVGGASLVLGEYHDQLSRHFPAHLAAGRAMVLPKQIDLALAGDGVPPTETEFDIVNVGTFAEPRKNQGALLQFAPRHRIAFVGGGPRMPEMRRAARQARLLDRIHFFGRVATGEVYPVLRRSRIMVHPSTGDGLPRATIEGGIPPGAGLLVSEEGLPHAVELLLADDGLRRRMGRAARRHIERNHGPPAIAAAAGELLRLLDAR